jgi:hypothetical protein
MRQFSNQKSEARALAVVLAGLLVVLTGCSKLGNPLAVDPNLPLGGGAGNLPTVALVSPANRSELVDDDPAATGIQATLVVTFSDYMDPGAVSSCVVVRNTSTGQDLGGLVISYEPEAKKLYIRHVDWTANAAYLLILSSGLAKNAWGTALDGNENGTAEESPHDDALSTFYTSGSNPGNCVATTPPVLDDISPDTVRITDTLPTITVKFTQDMDTTTLVPSGFTLMSETGSSFALNRTAVAPREVSFSVGAPLLFGHRYTVTVVASALRGTAPANTPEYLLKLDTDGDGPETQEPDYRSYFLCDTTPPPTVNAGPSGGHVEFDFDKVMDAGTMIPENLKVLDGDGYVPGSLVLTNDAPGNCTRVYCYYSRPVSGQVRAFVSHLVKSSQGILLDGSGNGIGGEPWDDYWSD